jgi:DNA gyrase subunit B
MEAQFEGQTKTKLGNSEIRTLVDCIVTEKLSAYLEENPSQAKIYLRKAYLRQGSRSRKESKRADSP